MVLQSVVSGKNVSLDSRPPYVTLSQGSSSPIIIKYVGGNNLVTLCVEHMQRLFLSVREGDIVSLSQN